jgi:hypothetical protein
MIAVDGKDIDPIDLQVDCIGRCPNHRPHAPVSDRLTGIGLLRRLVIDEIRARDDCMCNRLRSGWRLNWFICGANTVARNQTKTYDGE